ncbi:MAG: hypothetical protein ACD_45C00059G0002 [uncultured bacterium]|nr:MAG: hypothetical protein ACD_45C00059G0002 [uncultured bacterium]OGT08162.1 MAG: hypothetical protein A2V89_00385 [Gammaproteobacteria bacterium RBG_16_37_9]HBC72014.1 hypothetical protein [Coxiellaceae bacterium]HBY55507.1 hypothetical protein [Coxiellaceae bacterium]
MFDLLLSIEKLFLFSLCAFFIILTVRRLFIRRKILIFLYHGCLFIVFFVLAMGGEGVQNADYDRLEKFIQLEKNNQLEQARNNPKNYDTALQIDFKNLKNSNEFRKHIQRYDSHVDKEEALFIGWLLAFIAEISGGFIMLFNVLLRRIKNK